MAKRQVAFIFAGSYIAGFGVAQLPNSWYFLAVILTFLVGIYSTQREK